MRLIVNFLYIYIFLHSITKNEGFRSVRVMRNLAFCHSKEPSILNQKKFDKLPEGFEIFDKDRNIRKNKKHIKITSLENLKSHIRDGYKVFDLDIRGDLPNANEIGLSNDVVNILYRRKNEGSIPGKRSKNDTAKVALSIEGGGMRGSVAAGMVTALWYLGLENSIDVVYGSSAGSLVGAYFISGQFPHFGPEIYYDVLTAAGKKFIDTKMILRSCGLGLFDLRLESIFSLLKDRMGKPVINLDYLFEKIVKEIKPLDWNKFWRLQENDQLPLKVIASGLLSKSSIVLSAKDKNFESLDDLSTCMKASMLVPGMTGDAVRLEGNQAKGENIMKCYWPKYLSRSKKRLEYGSEPLCDALIFEPIPYRSAIKENCTHIIALRTRPDGVSVSGKLSLIEKMVLSRFFKKKLNLSDIKDWMHNQYHKLIYAEDILRLNLANRNKLNEDTSLDPNLKMLGIAMPKGKPEVNRLETSRSIILESVKNGFAAAYDILVLDPKEKGRGSIVASNIWPDLILDHPPRHLKTDSSSIGLNSSECIDLENALKSLNLPNLDKEKQSILVDSLLKLKNYLGTSH